ncbi:pentapeptide repeat-containing protein [Gordonia polyisoprenivorans]|uniref:pentapeptide repeat-containing protein n=1 Tax=Gordonia polyisoprenivorans TaxID=84595 RepID=UPI002233E9F7|nr:pentapeptide repeat-containing protein [Gordonia polyisoprenivorans]
MNLKFRLLTVGVVATALTALAGCSTPENSSQAGSSQAAVGSSAPRPANPAVPGGTIMVPPDNPYYTLLVEGTQPTVKYGQDVNGCVVKPSTSCANADLSGAVLRGASFHYADLTGANLSGAAVAFAGFTYASMANADLSNTTLTGVSLNEILGSIAFGHADQADFSQIQLGGNAAVNASMNGARFDHAGLTLTNLVGADLVGASFVGADGRLASFTGADLRGANLTGANLSQGSFTGANLTGANLSGANLTEANFLGADLTTANMAGATFCNTFMPDGTVKNPSRTGCP